MTADTAVDHAALDRAVADLRAGSSEWAGLALAEKIGLLDRLKPRVMAEAEGMVAATQRAKGIDPSSLWAAEDWLSGPWAFLQGVTSLLTTLRRVQNGDAPVPLKRIRSRADGRSVVEVFPATGVDALLLSGYSAEVWMRPGVTRERAAASSAAMYRGRGYERPGVSLVLGAGNVGSITTLDLLHVLYAEGSVAIVKIRADLRGVRRPRLAPVRPRRRSGRRPPRAPRWCGRHPHDRLRHDARRDRLGHRPRG
jgi:hypothetical protein